MITYSVAQVETLSGISAHSLRIWERRYDFIKPHRTETNIRYYSDEQLKKLINVGILIRNNFKISKVASMSDEEIHSIVSDLLLQPSTNQEEINALAVSMIDMDEQGFNRLYEAQIAQNGVVKAFTTLIYPFLQHVGVLWGINKTMPAQEHFISNLIRQKLVSATETLNPPKTDAPKLLLYLLEGEDHEIGLLLANYIAKDLGWKTYYLGANVPTQNIKAVKKQVKPDLMFSMLVSPRNSKFSHLLNEFLGDIDGTMLYSGSYDLVNQSEYKDRTIYLKSPEAFAQHLKDYSK